MALPWFKLYSEFLDDPKVQMMSEAMRYRLVALMCSQCKQESLTDKMFAYRWRVSLADVQETRAAFVEAGFIDSDWNLLNWKKRQAVSPGAVRTKRWRDKRVTATSPLRHSDAFSDAHVTTEEDIEVEQVRPEGKNYGF